MQRCAASSPTWGALDARPENPKPAAALRGAMADGEGLARAGGAYLAPALRRAGPRKVTRNPEGRAVQNHDHPRGAGPGDVVVSVAEFAALAGLSAEWVRLRIASGHIPRAARGRVSLGPAVAGVARYFAELSERAKESAEGSGRARYRAARAAEIEATTARTMADLIDRAEACQALATLRDLTLDALRKFVADQPRAQRAASREAIAEAEARIDKRIAILIKALRSGNFAPLSR